MLSNAVSLPAEGLPKAGGPREVRTQEVDCFEIHPAINSFSKPPRVVLSLRRFLGRLDLQLRWI